MQYLSSFAALSAFSLILCACGGGGGGGKATSPASSVATVSSAATTSAATSSVKSSISAASQSSVSSTGISASTVSNSSATGTETTSLTPPPSVTAGKDKVAIAGSSVTLTAVASGADVAPFSYAWTQISGPVISFVNAASASTTFTSPAVASPQQVLLKVIATDKNGSQYADTVTVYISSSGDLTRYEAEAATLSSTNVTTATPGFSGSGYVTGFNGDSADAVTWNVTINEAAYYRIGIGFQLEDSPKGFDFYLDNTKLTSTFTAGDKNFHETSLGRHWLTAGSHSFVIKGGWSYYNIDYMELIKVAAAKAPQTIPATLADGKAAAKTKALFKYITDSYGHKTLSGQQDVDELDTIFNYSGKRPTIFAIDLSSYDGMSVTAMGAPANVTENYISKIQANGYIASLIWHWHSPANAKSTSGTCPTSNDHCWWNSFYTVHSDFNLTTALADTDSLQYKAVIADIDRIAVQLKKLQDANIPVLWRPLHEADGGWFWWGAQGSDSYKKLWRLMYDRLTHYHQLHNLIWVITIVDPAWYPGDDVVDVVGADAYPEDKHDSLLATWEALLERYDGHKVLALSEYGGVPFITEMQAKGVWWAWFASWNDKDNSNPLGPRKMTNTEVNTIYNSAEVISLDELVIPTLD